jgi:sodium-dependent phosphate cotransporter
VREDADRLRTAGNHVMAIKIRPIGLLKVLAVFALLYFFLLSIKMMGSSFKMFGKGFAEQLIASCSNPFAGLFIGVLATSIVQSSSTVTSLVVGFVGGGILPLSFAIPIVMGANIGTSITNTLVSLTFVTRKEDFRRAFAGATVHDFFNLSSVAVLFPLEIKFHPVERAAVVLTRAFKGAGGAKFTSPLKLVIDPAAESFEHFLAGPMKLHSNVAATIMLVVSVALLIASLVLLVRTMRSIIASRAESFIERYLFRNDFLALLIGLALTLVVQSSSVTTSLVVPLVAAGVLSLRRCYPYTLGANIGTTCTALLASLATVTVAQGGHEVNAVGVTAALAHLCFNIFGILIFYPLRIVPITLAKRLADAAAESKKWVAVFIIGVYLVIPLLMIFVTR